MHLTRKRYAINIAVGEGAYTQAKLNGEVMKKSIEEAHRPELRGNGKFISVVMWM